MLSPYSGSLHRRYSWCTPLPSPKIVRSCLSPFHHPTPLPPPPPIITIYFNPLLFPPPPPPIYANVTHDLCMSSSSHSPTPISLKATRLAFFPLAFAPLRVFIFKQIFIPIFVKLIQRCLTNTGWSASDVRPHSLSRPEPGMFVDMAMLALHI